MKRAPLSRVENTPPVPMDTENKYLITEEEMTMIKRCTMDQLDTAALVMQWAMEKPTSQDDQQAKGHSSPEGLRPNLQSSHSMTSSATALYSLRTESPDSK